MSKIRYASIPDGQYPTVAKGHKPSFTMAQILADERPLSAVLLPVGDVRAERLLLLLAVAR